MFDPHELGFSEILFTPLDIRIDIDSAQLVSLVERYAYELTFARGDDVWNKVWNGLLIYSDDASFNYYKNSYGPSSVPDILKAGKVLEGFDNLYQQICTQFPYLKLELALIFIQRPNTEVPAHTDMTPYPYDSPTQFRVMLMNEAHGLNNIWTTSSRGREFLTFPSLEESNCFVLKNVVHGAIPMMEGKKKILLHLRGKIDRLKYKSLMDRSLAKFKPYVIQSHS